MNNFTRKSLFIFFMIGFGFAAYAQEPTAHPTGFSAATQSGTSVTLDWTGSVGANLPTNYIIQVRIVPGGAFETPVDGTPVADDDDLDDNLGAVNVPHAVGANTYTWTGLPVDTDFEFIIYPYTTGGTPDPDFRVDGSPLTVTASTKRPTVTSPNVDTPNIAETTATAGGNVTSDGGNALTAKGIVWKASTPGASLSDNVATHATTSTGPFTVNLTGLPEGTLIYYRAYATNAAGTSYSAESSFYTIATLPSANPTVGASAQLPTRINVTYTAPGSNGTNTDGYVILRRVGADPQTTEIDDGVAPGSLPLDESVLVRIVTAAGETSFNDDTVIPDTQYRYAVIPFNWDGTNPETYNYRIGAGFSIATATSYSSSSTITLIGTSTTLPYEGYRGTSITNANESNSLLLATFQIKDGNGSDNDNRPTRLTGLTIAVTNSVDVRRIALFHNGQQIPNTEQAAAATHTWDLTSYTLEAADNGTMDFSVRATFKDQVTDGHNIHVTITSATALNTGSGFIDASAGGAATAGNVNRIDVIAEKLRFVADPPATPVNTNFSLTVRALDHPLNNLDIDYTGTVELSKVTPSADGTLSAGAQSLTPNMVAGVFTWTQLQFNESGSYTLAVVDEAGLLLDDDAPVTITSSGANIKLAAPLTVCYGGAPQNLDAIEITETDNGGFSAGGTFTLSLPNGFVFDQTITGIGPVVSGGSDISGASNYSYPSANAVQFSYNINGTSNINKITISGLKVRAPHPGGEAPTPINGNITRSGGTAVIAGDASGTVHGSLTGQLGTPPAGGVGFTVVKVDPLHVNVLPNETRFAQSSNPVRLVGTPAGGVFSGPGVTFIPSPAPGEYRFNPQSLSPGNYDIVYTVENGVESCDFIFQKTFEVYVTNITGLAPQYCNNAPASAPLSVSSTYILNRYGAGFVLGEFVYWDTPTFTQMPIPPTGSDVIFDPKNPDYQPIYSSTASVYGVFGIWIGFTVTNGLFTYTEWQLIPVRPAPTPSFTISKTQFCSDEDAVPLIGTPANSNTLGDDFFLAAGQPSALTASAAPVQWQFNPKLVSGVTPGNPVSIPITYTYRDPATGCSGTSAPQVVTVSSRPSSVTAAMLSTPTTQQVCQGTSAQSFNATPAAGTTYTWYLNDQQTLAAIGDNFTPPSPPLNTSVPGATNFYVRRIVNGCESNREPTTPTTPLQLTVNVIGIPGQPAADRPLEYCVGETIPPNEFLIASANTIRWYLNGNLVTTGSNPSAASLGIDNSIAGFYNFEVTQVEPLNFCEGPLPPNRTKVSVEIKPLPVLSIESTNSDLLHICTTGPQITFQGKDGGVNTTSGTWSGTGLSGALLPGAGNAILTTTNMNPNDYTLGYQYTNARGCTSSTSVNLRVLPKIVPSLLPLDSCDGAFVRLNNTSTVSSGPLPPSTIAFTQWNFSDGSGLPSGLSADAIPAGTNSGRTKGTYFSPEHRFNTTGSFTLQYTMVTSDNCIYSATKQLTIHPKPKINFNWRGVCRDTLTGNSTTQFQAVELSTPQIPIPAANYHWDFNAEDILTYVSAGSGATPTVAYNVSGRDTAQLIVESAAHCRDTVRKAIFIVPSFTKLRETNSYSEDFNTSDGGWIAGGQNSSWAHGVLAGPVVNMDASANGQGMAWDTNPSGDGISNDREQSWVLCPCFTFVDTKKPIISMDIWSDTPLLNDGAVLQYNLTGNIENDADWFVLGVPEQGANWYDERGISSSPGNQSVHASGNDVGWTGIYNGWRTAAYKLDELNGQNSVVFRIAFASNVPRREGFAFDNVFIGERTRTVLLESFTNSSQPANTELHNTFFSTFSNNSTELAKLQFHTKFPGTDPLNAANSEINNSRAAFYGITETGKFAIDGTVVTAPAALTKIYDDRVLTPSPVRIIVSHVKDGEVVKINTTLKNITNQSFPTTGLTFFVAIAEKSITDPDYLGTESNEFRFVARKMLPNASGTIITQDIPALGEITLPEMVWNDPGLLPGGEAVIVVFIQSTEGDNKTVIQSRVIDASVIPDVATGISFPEAEGRVLIYPNPANHTVNIQYDAPLNESMQVRLVDTFGKEVFSGTMRRGERTTSIRTTDFTPGMYLVRFKRESGAVAWGKVVITH